MTTLANQDDYRSLDCASRPAEVLLYLAKLPGSPPSRPACLYTNPFSQVGARSLRSTIRTVNASFP